MTDKHGSFLRRGIAPPKEGNTTDEKDIMTIKDEAATDSESVASYDEAEAPNPAAALTSTRGDKIGTVAVCVAVIAAAAYMLIEGLGYKEPVGGDPGAAAVPRLIAVMCIVVAVTLIVQTIRRPLRDDGEVGVLHATMRVAIIVAVIAVALLLLPHIGYMISMTILMFASGYLAGSRTWWSNALVSVLGSWLSLLLFSRVFSVPLPMGPLDHLIGG